MPTKQKVATTKCDPESSYDYKFTHHGINVRIANYTDDPFRIEDGWGSDFDNEVFNKKRNLVNYIVDAIDEQNNVNINNVPVVVNDRKIKTGAPTFNERKASYNVGNKNDVLDVVTRNIEGWNKRVPVILVLEASGNVSRVIKANGTPEMMREVFKEGAENCILVAATSEQIYKATRVARDLEKASFNVLDIICIKNRISLAEQGDWVSNG